MRLKPENETPGIIKDHQFIPKNINERWGVCRCGLAEAAHISAVNSYKIPKGTPHRCPDCVTTNKEFCTHG